MVYPILKRIVRPILKIWLKKVVGLENVPKNKVFIVAANHQSYLDHFIIQSTLIHYLNKKIHYLAKKEHFKKYFERKWHQHVGAIPIDRQAGGKDALKWAVHALNKGKVIGMYPEGTRTLTGKMQRAKTGVARLALAARVPVLPVGVRGAFDILPKGKRIPKHKRAEMHIGKLMYFESFYGKEDKGTYRKVTDLIMKEIARLAGQEYNF